MINPADPHGQDQEVHSHEEHHHAPSASLTSAVIRMAAATAKAAGYVKVGTLITDWPEITGTKLGELIRKLRNAEQSGKTVTAAEQAEIEKALEANPQAAAQLLGLVVSSSSQKVLDAAEERRQILASYKLVLDLITSAMTQRQTSYALKGFLHNPECISYWKRSVGSAEFVGDDSLYCNGFEVYFINVDPSLEKLQALNEFIRRSESRHLPNDYEDYRHNQGIVRLMRVRELEVEVEELQPDDPGKAAFGIQLPRQVRYEIPLNGPDQEGLLESLLEAQRVQSEPSRLTDRYQELAQEYKRKILGK